jgi:ketosteroid isomerase-like protein
MAEESTTPDLEKLVRGTIDPVNIVDLDAVMRFYASDCVWDASPMGMESVRGSAAIRALMQEWFGSYETVWMQSEEILDLGNGVAFAVIRQGGRPVGSSGDVQMRYASVSVWADGLVERVTNYLDIDEARAAAERLAEERG